LAQLTHRWKQRDVKFDENTYEFRATKDYEEGDEVFMNYGSHPNDTLLAECEKVSLFSSLQRADLAFPFLQMASSLM
jgi:hypothetical protein